MRFFIFTLLTFFSCTPSIGFAQLHFFDSIPPSRYFGNQAVSFETYDSTMGRNWGYVVLNYHDHRVAMKISGGAIFDLDSIPGKMIRLDSTTYYGYNFGALHFSTKQNIFKYGGYGFWTTQGLLLSMGHLEWEFNPLNKKITCENENHAFFNPKSNDLFSLMRPSEDQSYRQQELIYNFEVYKCSLNDCNWRSLGWLIPELRTPSIHVLMRTNNGILVQINNANFVFLNFNNFRMYILSSKLQSKITELGYLKREYNLIPNNDEWWLIPKVKNSTLSGKKWMSFSDFEKELIQDRVFVEKNITLLPLFIGSIVALVIIVLAYFFELKSKKKDHLRIIHHALPEPLCFIPFTDKELLLIQLLLKRKSINEYTSVLDINSVLEIEEKTIDHQKKIRSEIIKSINNKYQAALGLNHPLVERYPNPSDRRIIDFSIFTE